MIRNEIRNGIRIGIQNEIQNGIQNGIQNEIQNGIRFFSFSHLSTSTIPMMVDVSNKMETYRMAKAQSIISIPTILVKQLNENRNLSNTKYEKNEIISAKGPVFATAIVAGTMAVKQTANLIPFCHNIFIEAVSIDIMVEDTKELNLSDLDDQRNIIITCDVKCSGKTGVEMEALVGASVAALTIYV